MVIAPPTRSRPPRPGRSRRSTARRPTVLALTRQGLPTLRPRHDAREPVRAGRLCAARGGGRREVTLIATGSEVAIAMAAAALLADRRHRRGRRLDAVAGNCSPASPAYRPRCWARPRASRVEAAPASAGTAGSARGRLHRHDRLRRVGARRPSSYKHFGITAEAVAGRDGPRHASTRIIKENRMALITLSQLLDHAAEHGYGVPAFNINNMEQGLAIMAAAKAVDAPVIIQASRGARNYANDIMLAQDGRRPWRDLPGHPALHAPGPRQQRGHLPVGDPPRLHLGDDGRLARGRRQDAGRLRVQRRDHRPRRRDGPLRSAPRSRASSACSARWRPARARPRTATAPRASWPTSSC